jgi:hypothetical protein
VTCNMRKRNKNSACSMHACFTSVRCSRRCAATRIAASQSAHRMHQHLMTDTSRTLCDVSKSSASLAYKRTSIGHAHAHAHALVGIVFLSDKRRARRQLEKRRVGVIVVVVIVSIRDNRRHFSSRNRGLRAHISRAHRKHDRYSHTSLNSSRSAY